MNMSSYKKAATAAVLGLSLLGGAAVGSAQASSISFKDVSKSYWGYSSIRWGAQNKLITGYPDGTFKPNRAVDGNEFLAMLIRAYHPADLKEGKGTGNWASAYLGYAKKLGWKTASTGAGFTRAEAAVYLANATGHNYSTEDSILYLMDQGLIQGKSGLSLSGYQQQDKVTRTEALALIQRLKGKISKLKAVSSTRQSYLVENLQYRNDKYGFTLKLPKSWADKYEVRETVGKDGYASLDFISKAAKKSASGIVFTIGIWPEKDWKASEKEIKGQIPIWQLAGKGGKVYALHTPTDVQVLPDDAKVKKEYDLLFAGVKKLKSTFNFTK
ncbi:S-layer homology domain-containing protein [Paenibacillus tuaregi]|uniref:S-layer homology domain-containing protein n=1 Tax=Paenibacillus tuaregi TaxID=1816681 RepID=UPI0009EDE7DD|nr:S-layer homology domain-containing protein [Paenibacillus tuaregi]